ncbi:MAG: hypothetical protein IPM46_07835 [Flavobacteriales bacterium]|nr:hypothetical protein [Flavobacteriales bacterium]
MGETVFLLIPESDGNWPKLAKYMASDDDLTHTVELQFSKEDIRNSEYCELGSTRHFGFPQPEDDYQQITYDPVMGCRTCGIGLMQVAPFRFRKTPTQRHSHLLQLNWVFDEFFVSERTRADLESSILTGFRFEPAVLHKSGQPLNDWHQMRIDGRVPGVVDTSAFVKESCATCGKSKFNHPTDQPIHIQLNRSDLPDIAKTSEWFGSGGSAWQSILVSKNFVDLVLSENWRGISLAPVRITADHNR